MYENVLRRSPADTAARFTPPRSGASNEQHKAGRIKSCERLTGEHAVGLNNARTKIHLESGSLIQSHEVCALSRGT